MDRLTRLVGFAFALFVAATHRRRRAGFTVRENSVYNSGYGVTILPFDTHPGSRRVYVR